MQTKGGQINTDTGHEFSNTLNQSNKCEECE
jgi:hypothetical protein